MDIVLRPATRADARDLARLVEMAGEGLPSHIWASLAASGEDVWSVGERRAARDEGAFSWRNAVMAEAGGDVAGALVAYGIVEASPADGLPPLFRPIQRLENTAVGTHYVNVLATYPAFRRRGVARALIGEAERQAAGRALSLIVADGNSGARRLYEALGFREKGREPIVPEGWRTESKEWILMLRPAGG